MSAPIERYEWRVVYRRRRWHKTQSRRYDDEYWARRFLAKLLGGGRPDLAPFVKLRFERRVVGEWQDVEGDLAYEPQPSEMRRWS